MAALPNGDGIRRLFWLIVHGHMRAVQAVRHQARKHSRAGNSSIITNSVAPARIREIVAPTFGWGFQTAAGWSFNTCTMVLAQHISPRTSAFPEVDLSSQRRVRR